MKTSYALVLTGSVSCPESSCQTPRRSIQKSRNCSPYRSSGHRPYPEAPGSPSSVEDVFDAGVERDGWMPLPLPLEAPGAMPLTSLCCCIVAHVQWMFQGRGFWPPGHSDHVHVYKERGNVPHHVYSHWAAIHKVDVLIQFSRLFAACNIRLHAAYSHVYSFKSIGLVTCSFVWLYRHMIHLLH